MFVDEIATRMHERTARGLAMAVGSAVGDGAVRPGERVPPIRELARALGVSPTTITAAWSMLRRAGTIETGGRRGTFIAAQRAGPSRYRKAMGAGIPVKVDLSRGTPDVSLLPDLEPALLRTLDAGSSSSTYLDDPMLPRLEKVLRTDWPFDAERLTIVDGALDAVQLTAACHLSFGDTVAIEDPCFPPLLDLLDSVGARPYPLTMDAEGPRVSDVQGAIRKGVRALLVQPRAHNPTGITMSESRVAALSHALAKSDVLVIEIDSMGPIGASPVRSLGAARPRHTVHIRSFSKGCGPDLRLAAIGGSSDLVDEIIDRRLLGQGWTSRLLQGVLADLLTEPDSVHAISSARQEYARRRHRVVVGLRNQGIDVPGEDGFNIWLPVADEGSTLLFLAAHNIGVLPGAPFSVVPPATSSNVRVTTSVVAADHDEIAAQLALAAQHRRPPQSR